MNTCFACGEIIKVGTKCPKCGCDIDDSCPLLEGNKCKKTRKVCIRLNKDYYGCKVLLGCQL